MSSCRLLVVACLCVVGAGLSGCAEPETFVASGLVRVDGKPAGGVYLAFHDAVSASQGSPASARTVEDGSFEVRLPSAGEYAVTAFWPTELLDEGSVVEGPDRFAGRYRNPQQPVATVNVQSGANTLAPLDLKSR
jgi:hypothetical protein